jgi:hypothetical protein
MIDPSVKEELLREAEAFDPALTTHELLLELTHLDEDPETVEKARELLDAFFAEAAGG